MKSLLGEVISTAGEVVVVPPAAGSGSATAAAVVPPAAGSGSATASAVMPPGAGSGSAAAAAVVSKPSSRAIVTSSESIVR